MTDALIITGRLDEARSEDHAETAAALARLLYPKRISMRPRLPALFPRTKPHLPPETTPPSPRAIAAGIAKPNALVVAETELHELRAAREMVMDEVRGLANQLGNRDAERRLVALHERRAALEEKIRDARRRRAEAAAPYDRAVTRALEPLARDCGERIRAATTELSAALATAAEIAEAGSRDLAVPTVNFPQFEDLSKRLCATGSK